MLRKTEGIVLRTFPYGEADLIVTYLTKDFGIVKTFAKSPRKVKSRFGSSLEPLTNSEIAFWGKEDSPLPRLTQSDIIYPFHSIRSAYQCFLAVSEIVELILTLVPEGDCSRNVYDFFSNALHAVESDCRTGLLILHYKLKLLEIVGFLPHLGSCGRCGKDGTAFYIAHGTVLCKNCSRGIESPIAISEGLYNLYSSLLKWRSSKINRIKPPETLLLELSALINEHVKYITERNLKTHAFKVR